MIYSARYFELHMVVVSIPYSTYANEYILKLIAVVVGLDISKGIKREGLSVNSLDAFYT